ncbi:class I SAM-dependent methyltransferase [Daejeonella oryzae]|uniref:class I SAM-dependent methyltransferase n=1 Tax=Daejeonella oryzae TaxID=1122943 RepID=UPI000408D968|nr:class I SAM-dependent methyltransferase [Daejeonella oryzae]
MENKCFLCHQHSSKSVYQEKGYNSLVCPECGLLFCNPLPDIETINWEMDSHSDPFYKLSSYYKARWLNKKIGKNMILLEVGSGNGHQLHAFAQFGYEVFGLEPNYLRLGYMKNIYKIMGYQGFIETFDFNSKKFDVIFHVDLLAHFPDPFLSIEQMKKALKQNGYISFEVGVVGGISSYWYRLFPLGLPQHRWLYSEKSLAKLLQKAQLQVIHKTTHSLVPYLLIGKVVNFALLSVMMRLVSPLIGKHASIFFKINSAISNFLRYKLGRYFPKVGPLTILYITKPI